MSLRSFATRSADLAVGEQVGTLFTQLSGRAVPYNEPTDIGPFIEEIAPGTFRESLQKASTLPLHLFHGDVPGQSDSTPWPIGLAATWDDRRDGLYGKWLLDTTDEAQDAAQRVDRGMLRFMSIRFQPDQQGAVWTRGRVGAKDHVRWTKGRLVSVSLVSAPAYPGALVTDVRSLDAAEHTAALDAVRCLAIELGNAHVVNAITGTPGQMRLACNLVYTAVASLGGTAAGPHLADLAASMYDTDPGSALNVARAAQCLEPGRITTELRDAHKQRWHTLVASSTPAARTTPRASTTPRRRRRPLT